VPRILKVSTREFGTTSDDIRKAAFTSAQAKENTTFMKTYGENPNLAKSRKKKILGTLHKDLSIFHYCW
jgi:hypothetical protein